MGIFKNRKGFTIIEVLAVIGIASVIGLMSLQVISMLLQGSSSLRSKLGHVSLQKDLQSALRKKDSCLASLQNQTFSGGSRNPVSVELDNRIRVGGDEASGNGQELRPYDVRVKSLILLPVAHVALVGTDSIYNVRLILDAEPLSGGTSFASVPVATLRIHVRSGQIQNCELVGEYTEVMPVTCESMAGALIDGVCHLSPNVDPIACGSSEYMNGFDTEGRRTCLAIPVRPGPTPPPPPPPPPPAPNQLWTWQGLQYQTTCPGYCDGVEWASCAGPSCGGARIWCYCASLPGVPCHPAGSTQDTQPTGFICAFF